MDNLVRAAADSASEGALRPFLRWAGSKRKLVGRLKSYWQPQHRRYIEPFAGSACLFFDVRPDAAILGDSNRGLIELYREVQKDPEGLFRRLVRIPRDTKTYYRWRAMHPSAADRQTRALRFIYLNRNCFNGIYRTNACGEFNVPFGEKQGRPLGKMDQENFLRCAKQLCRAKLICGDFLETSAHAGRNDFVYMDPPFAVGARRVFSQYGKRAFSTDDVPRLGTELRRLHKVGAQFLVSYADCSEARALASEWSAIRLRVRRNVAGFSRDRRNATEWLISNMTHVKAAQE